MKNETDSDKSNRTKAERTMPPDFSQDGGGGWTERSEKMQDGTDGMGPSAYSQASGGGMGPSAYSQASRDGMGPSAFSQASGDGMGPSAYSQASGDGAGPTHRLRHDQDVQTDQVIFALSNAVEAKDRYTNGHSQRVARYAKDIVRNMGGDVYMQRQAYYAGMIHDVGKIRVPDTIINNVGLLTDAEYEEVKLHTLAGYYILKEITSISDFAVGARWHHERYDGKGYPNGLSGENIPWVARVIGVADAYDAMTSNRSYREILPQKEVYDEIRRGMGTQFDPKMAKVMLAMIEEDKDYRMRQPDHPAKRTILAIDDDPMVLKLLEFTLKSNPVYRLVTASSGKQGMEFLQEKATDLVLLDVEMPEIDGFDILAWIRRRNQSLPVIFMTGDKELEIIRKAESMGVSDYLTKPLVPKMLHESIQNVLSTSRYVQQKA